MRDGQSSLNISGALSAGRSNGRNGRHASNPRESAMRSDQNPLSYSGAVRGSSTGKVDVTRMIELGDSSPSFGKHEVPTLLTSNSKHEANKATPHPHGVTDFG